MSEAKDKPYDLFISYAAADRQWVEGFLLEGLRASGVRCFTQADFTLGARWTTEFERAVARSYRVLLVLSQGYLCDLKQQFLDNLARYHELNGELATVIPLLLEKVKLPVGLEQKVSLPAVTSADQTAALERLAHDCGGEPIRPDPKPACPYPGMKPFGEEAASLFRGRAREVRELLGQLDTISCVFVLGASGSGKSSLMRAGVVPSWRARNGAAEVLRPGETPPTRLEDLPASATGCRHLLVVDQFEELFTLAKKEPARQFQEALIEWLRTLERRLLVAVRADFYSQLMESPLFERTRANCYNLPRLKGDALREAIVEPAREVNVFVEKLLVERLMHDAGDEPGVLPHIQATLASLWEDLQWRYLPLSAYESMGEQGRPGLHVAMARWANTVLLGLSQENVAVLRRILLRLVQFGEGRPDTRKRQHLSKLRERGDQSEEFDKVLTRLLERRLLVTGEEAGPDPSLDIAHEALIAGWPELTNWIDEHREAEQVRRRLVAKVEEWNRRGKGSAGLLDEVQLREAKRWLESPVAAELGSQEVVAELVQASHVHMEAVKESARRKTRNTIIVLAAGLAVVAGLAIWGGVNSSNLSTANKELVEEVKKTKKARDDANTEAENARKAEEVAKRRRMVSVAQVLAFRSLRKAPAGEDDGQNALLARQAYLFNQRFGGTAHDQVNEALRTVLNDSSSRLSLRSSTHAQDGRVNSVAFSPNGQWLAVGEEWEVRLWDLSDPRAGPTILPKKLGPSSVQSLAFGPDSRRLAAGGASGEVSLWDLTESKPEEQRLKAARVRIQQLAFSHDGQLLYAFGLEGKLRQWDLTRVNAAPIVLKDTKGYKPAAFSADGRWMACGEKDKVELWNLSAPSTSPTILSGHAAQVGLIALSPDGRQLAAISFSGKLEPLNTPDGMLLAPARDSQKLRIWNLASTKPTYTESSVEGIDSPLAFSLDGRWLAAGGWDRQVRLWDPRHPTAAPRLLPLSPHTMMPLLGREVPNKILSVTFSSDAQLLAVGGFGGVLDLWNLSETNSVTSLPGHSGGVNSVAFNPENSQQLASAGTDGTIRLWDLRLPSLFITFFSPETSKNLLHLATKYVGLAGSIPVVRGVGLAGSIPAQEALLAATLLSEPIRTSSVELVTFCGERQSLVAVSHDGVSEWNLKQPTMSPKSVSAGLAFGTPVISPEAQRLILALEGNLWQFDLSHSGAKFFLIGSMKEHTAISAWGMAIAISPNGQLLASGCSVSGKPGTVRLWSFGQKWESRVLVGPCATGVMALAFSRDGQQLVAADYGQENSGGQLRIWKLNQPEAEPVVLRRQDRGHPTSVTFSPDGSMVASGDSEGTVRVWNLRQPQANPIILTGHTGGVRSVAFNADGRWLASGGTDGKVKVWTVRTEDLAEMVCTRVWRNLTIEEWRHFVGEDIPYERTCANLPPGKGAPLDAPAGTTE